MDSDIKIPVPKRLNVTFDPPTVPKIKNRLAESVPAVLHAVCIPIMRTCLCHNNIMVLKWMAQKVGRLDSHVEVENIATLSY